MDSCDVLIVGGGPAGSSCAWKLALGGLDTIILDKSHFPRHKSVRRMDHTRRSQRTRYRTGPVCFGAHSSAHHWISHQHDGRSRG